MSRNPQSALVLDPARVAVLLNAHAKSVTPKAWRTLEAAMPPEDLFLSSRLDEAWEIAERVLQGGYGTILTGGGDGTFMGFVNAVLDRFALARHAGEIEGPPPCFGLLKLGTGNAIAGYIGATSATPSGLNRDLSRVRAGAMSTRHLDLISCEGLRSPFLGLGVDARVINDYAWLRSTLGHGPLRPLTRGGVGYALAISGRTVPAYVAQDASPTLRVINRGAPALRVDLEGEPVGEPLPEGATLFEGTAKIVAAATVPCYGFGFRLFPHADRVDGRMHLRVASEPVHSILFNLRQIWRGRYHSAHVCDLLVDDVEIQSEQPMPFQVGGDAAGEREQVRFTISREPLRLLHFND